jgi:peptide/nickel transport system substrate-binding protein
MQKFGQFYRYMLIILCLVTIGVVPGIAQEMQYNEAPMLAERVAAGELPPVGERLPAEPLVVEPTNMVGQYGGTLYCAGLAPETTNDCQIGTVTGLFRFSHDLSEAEPEVAESYEFSEDYTSVTIKLREGIKWSDGVPFTADDVLFYFEDWQLDPDLFPATPAIWQPGGEVMQVSKVDDYTVQFDFAVPNPAFALIHYSAAPAYPYRPRHFMEAFHLKYNPEANNEAQAGGFDTWQARFTNTANTYGYGAQNPDMPVLDPWMPVSRDTQGMIYERNPYYFKVDTEGNQLPYIDMLDIEYVTDLEVMNLKTISGELSIAGLDMLLVNYPVIREAQEAAGYRTVLVYSERGADVALALNQVHPDPVLREIFNDVRFRQALSVGINRDEINELVFLGQGTPRQATINEDASFFKQEWADHYAQFDPDLANQLLDEIGLTRGADGVRTRPDGQPLAFQLEFLPHEGPKTEVAELVVRHWRDLGLQVDAASRERSFLSARLNAMEQDMSGWHVDRQLERTAYAYGWEGSKLGPGGNSAILYANGWRLWLLSGGEQGVEPPQAAKDLAAAFADWQKTVIGTPEYEAAGIHAYDLVAENLWVIGVIGGAPQPIVVANNLENVFSEAVYNGDERVWWGAANWFWHPHHPEQWFFTS